MHVILEALLMIFANCPENFDNLIQGYLNNSLKLLRLYNPYAFVITFFSPWI